MLRKPWLLVSAALMAVYLVYVIWAKWAAVLGAPPVRLGETSEFLLFLASIVAFSLQVFVEDARRGDGERGGGILSALDRNAERYLMLACYVFCCAVIIQDVARRFLLNYSAAWSQETAQYAFIYLGWIGAAYAVKERAHIRFDILQNKLPARLHGWLFIAGEIATILFAVIALRFSMHTIATLWQYGAATPVLRVSKLWAEAAVPIGFVLIVLRSVQAMARDMADMRTGRDVFRGKALFEE